MQKKKFIVVLVNNSISELDWILPVLNSLKSNYFIFIYFKNYKIFSSLKSNDVLSKLLNKTTKFYFIENFYDLFFYKVLKKTLNFMNLNIFPIDFFERKIHDLNRLKDLIKKKTNINNIEIDFIFSDYGINSGWVKIITKYNNTRPKIVHYPHSPQSFYSKKKIVTKYKLYGDILLVGRKKDKSFFSNFISIKKIYSCGIPKYDLSWKNKILKNSEFDFDYNKLKKFNLITFAYVSKFENFTNKSNELSKQLEDVMKVFEKIENTLVIFKVHPRKNSKKFLKILEKFDKRKWILSKTHLTKLSSISSSVLCHPNSAAGLDALSQNIPSIQLWPVQGVESSNDIQKKLGFIKSAKNMNMLKKLILLSIKKPNHKIWIDQRKNFRKEFPFLNKYINISKNVVINK
ncbi:MAG: hypothetical protein CBB97_05695 [Candidatus Endolissoclinum sp. TMED37]|nr:MAG: hypothetical protein CBB97_05695 [Candidatus Endolissoclinum sp. TMED37]|tara:strand:- start:855 stop:2063 length:1209 start_codon:yes stop_codon:yes gene_type:complete